MPQNGESDVDDSARSKLIKTNWLHDEEDLINNSPSQLDGISFQLERLKKREGCEFIFNATKKVMEGIDETRLISTAAYFFHRFYTIQSLKKCDPIDVAAASVLVTCKPELYRTPLLNIVKIVWNHKYPSKQPTDEGLQQLKSLVILLEALLLKTLGFDLNIQLPHYFILKIMGEIDQGSGQNVEVVKSAYFLATEMLLFSNWSVRFSSPTIAAACLKIAGISHRQKMCDITADNMGEDWYKVYEPSLKSKVIRYMTSEIVCGRVPAIYDLIREKDHRGFKKIITERENVYIRPIKSEWRTCGRKRHWTTQPHSSQNAASTSNSSSNTKHIPSLLELHIPKMSDFERRNPSVFSQTSEEW
ncbi:hypothetical protein GCK72_025198 [Caenorhabditis remanei]|uniref:Uncharacterized protein n=1 Tax=Caenorhabditis remanei TaxID=31234 RepID=A0A6A5G1U0_CAERE|nr:hypothetical protein GCK72_025198 [Caenorhabditis remanei]KAF1748731.1 hypothetical protein GCK72_025198 [Caenorhabditis remanei]